MFLQCDYEFARGVLSHENNVCIESIQNRHKCMSAIKMSDNCGCLIQN